MEKERTSQAEKSIINEGEENNKASIRIVEDKRYEIRNSIDDTLNRVFYSAPEGKYFGENNIKEISEILSYIFNEGSKSFPDHPEAKKLFDISSNNLDRLAQKMLRKVTLNKDQTINIEKTIDRTLSKGYDRMVKDSNLRLKIRELKDYALNSTGIEGAEHQGKRISRRDLFKIRNEANINKEKDKQEMDRVYQELDQEMKQDNKSDGQ